MATAYEHLVALLTDKFEVPPADIAQDATLADIGLDSLAAAELHVTLQDAWESHDKEGEITDKSTLRQAVAVLETWMPPRHSDLEDAAP